MRKHSIFLRGHHRFRNLNKIFIMVPCLRYLHARREAYKVGAQAETGTLSSGEAHGRAEHIQDGEDGGGDHGDGEDLLNLRGLLGDDDHRHSNGETLQEILDDASQELRCHKTVHVSLYSGCRKKYPHTRPDERLARRQDELRLKIAPTIQE
jgi:hypothetical protein